MLANALRWPLRVIPKSAVVPILSGHNRGMKWIVGAGQHGCWLGSYESFCVNRIAEMVRPCMSVFDIGAQAGYYTLMFSRRVGPKRKVFAFEGNHINAANLRRHLDMNRITNTELVEGAVSNCVGVGHFHGQGYIG